MSADPSVGTLIGSVADGDAIDWSAIEAGADDDLRRLVAHLRTAAAVADIHRTPGAGDDAPPSDEGGATTTPGSAPLGELGRWGHLQLVRKVGEGSYGEVFHARDTWLDHPVALKLLRADLSDRVAPTTLLDEARVLVKVRHPNVVAVHGADLQQGRVGFWMEFVQGQRLDDLVAFQGLLSAEDAARIGRELCGALAAVHDAGLVHRDVKAQNVIRDPKGRVVLMDFGAGQLMADTARGGGAGTPLYLAPEMFAGGHATVQTDVYALGVLLYYLVTAAYPVPARSLEELKDAHAKGRRRPLQVARPGLPRRFATVVETMLAADPAARYQTADDALAALDRFTAPASMVRKLMVIAGWLATAAVATTTVGLLNTSVFNLLLGRASEFHDELNLSTWFRWGLSSLLAPAIYMGFAVISFTIVAGAIRLARRISPACAAVLATGRSWVTGRAADWGLDEPGLVLPLVVGAGALALGVLYWSFWDYGAGFVAAPPFVDRAAAGRLAALGPSQEPRMDLYGWLLDLLIVAYGLTVVRIRAWARRVNAPLSRASRLTALLVPVFALIFWEAPYRLMYQSSFDRVDLHDARCYELGRSSGEVLLHCPDAAPPRNQVVSATDARLQPRGVRENIFLPADSSHPTR